ncbi:hypothetical protein [Oceanisphaera sp. W20_SRM_FM3]|uniref:hypothetical protein n=1 Tax=Oceanisphaera sp. W20_SRM_FM3 TaxID=3240267 RepID=UPI003F9B4D4A
MTKRSLWIGLLLPSLLLASPLWAADGDSKSDDSNEINQAISTATEAYQAGELSQAVTQLDYAATLIRQLQAGELGKLFPEPLSGWEADKVDSQAGAAGLFGGGINASRSYRKGDNRLEISIMKDSPLLQTMGMLFANPSMATMGGYKVKRIKGHTAMSKAEDNSQELQMMIDNRILLQFHGRNISEDDLNAYAEAIDIEAITKL